MAKKTKKPKATKPPEPKTEKVEKPPESKAPKAKKSAEPKKAKEVTVKVTNPTEDTMYIPVSYYMTGNTRIPNCRRIKPKASMQVSEETVDVCLNMGCTTKHSVKDLPNAPGGEEE